MVMVYVIADKLQRYFLRWKKAREEKIIQNFKLEQAISHHNTLIQQRVIDTWREFTAKSLRKNVRGPLSLSLIFFPLINTTIHIQQRYFSIFSCCWSSVSGLTTFDCCPIAYPNGNGSTSSGKKRTRKPTSPCGTGVWCFRKRSEINFVICNVSNVD